MTHAPEQTFVLDAAFRNCAGGCWWSREPTVFSDDFHHSWAGNTDILRLIGHVKRGHSDWGGREVPLRTFFYRSPEEQLLTLPARSCRSACDHDAAEPPA